VWMGRRTCGWIGGYVDGEEGVWMGRRVCGW
jgi:hypothetical protein